MKVFETSDLKIVEKLKKKGVEPFAIANDALHRFDEEKANKVLKPSTGSSGSTPTGKPGKPTPPTKKTN